MAAPLQSISLVCYCLAGEWTVTFGTDLHHKYCIQIQIQIQILLKIVAGRRLKVNNAGSENNTTKQY